MVYAVASMPSAAERVSLSRSATNCRHSNSCGQVLISEHEYSDAGHRICDMEQQYASVAARLGNGWQWLVSCAVEDGSALLLHDLAEYLHQFKLATNQTSVCIPQARNAALATAACGISLSVLVHDDSTIT